jgi:hypothetical protein
MELAEYPYNIGLGFGWGRLKMRNATRKNELEEIGVVPGE